MAPNLRYETVFDNERKELQQQKHQAPPQTLSSSLGEVAKKLRSVSFDDHRTHSFVIDDGEKDDEIQQILREALSRIRVMDEDWVDPHGGGAAEVYSVPTQLLERLASRAPSSLPARVADWNENLCYEFQPSHRLQGLGLEDFVRNVLKARSDNFVGSYLTTESTIPQPAHVDYTWEILEDHPHLYLGFFPLTEEGMYLQVWWPQEEHSSSQNNVKNKIEAELLFIPYGRLLVLPANTIHAGGFRSTPPPLGQHGNLRFHLYLARHGDTLPTHQTNKYTEPHDKRRELCDRYVDMPGLDQLQEYLFV